MTGLAASAQTHTLPADSVPAARPLGCIAVQAGVGAGLSIGATQLIKSEVEVWRPNGENRQSMPSRHASWAYMGASIASHELYRVSPWFPLAAQAGAGAIGMQRVMSLNHRPVDVMAGALIGMGGVELGYQLGYLIWPECRPKLQGGMDDPRFSVSLNTKISQPVCRDDKFEALYQGLQNDLSFRWYMGSNWGLQAVGTFESRQNRIDFTSPGAASDSKDFSSVYGVTRHFGALAGAYATTATNRMFTASASLSAGFLHNERAIDANFPHFSYVVDFDTRGELNLTRSLAMGLSLGYRQTTGYGAVNLGWHTTVTY